MKYVNVRVRYVWIIWQDAKAQSIVYSIMVNDRMFEIIKKIWGIYTSQKTKNPWEVIIQLHAFKYNKYLSMKQGLLFEAHGQSLFHIGEKDIPNS